MKSILIALFLLAAGSTVAFAQCDKKVSLSASKTEHYDANGGSKGTHDEKTIVEFDKTDMTVSISDDGGDHKMSGKIKSSTCDWKVPFKDGKTTMLVTLTREGDGESRDFTVMIEGKDGKVTLSAESKEEPDDKVKLPIDKFEEKK